MHSLKFNSSVLFVSNIENSKKFYVEILGQEIEHDFGANIIFKSGLSIWEISEGHEISGVKGSSKEGNTFELYFESSDIGKDAEILQRKHVKFLHGIKTESWGQRTMRFFDPDNHLIEIGEEFAIFIARIYHETDSVEETSKRTGVPMETISRMVEIKGM